MLSWSWNPRVEGQSSVEGKGLMCCRGNVVERFERGAEGLRWRRGGPGVDVVHISSTDACFVGMMRV